MGNNLGARPGHPGSQLLAPCHHMRKLIIELPEPDGTVKYLLST